LKQAQMRAILEPGGVLPGDRENRTTPAPTATANYQRHPCVTRRSRQALEPQRLNLPFSAHPEVLESTFFCPPRRVQATVRPHQLVTKHALGGDSHGRNRNDLRF